MSKADLRFILKQCSQSSSSLSRPLRRRRRVIGAKQDLRCLTKVFANSIQFSIGQFFLSLPLPGWSASTGGLAIFQKSTGKFSILMLMEKFSAPDR